MQFMAQCLMKLGAEDRYGASYDQNRLSGSTAAQGDRLEGVERRPGSVARCTCIANALARAGETQQCMVSAAVHRHCLRAGISLALLEPSGEPRTINCGVSAQSLTCWWTTR